MSALAGRVQRLMRSKKTNARRVAAEARLGATDVYDIINGKNKNPTEKVLIALAKTLGVSVSYLTQGRAEVEDMKRGGIAAIPVIGTAEAGAFRKMSEFGLEEHDLPTVDAPRSAHFPAARHFSVKIRGDSMNAARPFPFVDGMHALCVDMADAGLVIESGRIYAVRRTLDNGQTWELTIKRAQVFRDRVELRPESTNRAHEPIIVPRASGDETNAKTVEAIGYVYGSFGSFEG